MTADLQYRNCPLTLEDIGPIGWIAGEWIALSPTTGAIGVDDQHVLSVQPNGTYATRGRDKIGPWETFTVDQDANLLHVTTGDSVHYQLPYRGL